MEVRKGGPGFLHVSGDPCVGIMFVSRHDVNGIVAKGPHIGSAVMAEVAGLGSVAHSQVSLAIMPPAAVLSVDQGANGKPAIGVTGVDGSFCQPQISHFISSALFSHVSLESQGADLGIWYHT